MSIILDALRRGRGMDKPASNPTAAQTRAVLQTLGYGPCDAAAPRNRLKSILAKVTGRKWKVKSKK
jgi:hypothetical protein